MDPSDLTLSSLQKLPLDVVNLKKKKKWLEPALALKFCPKFGHKSQDTRWSYNFGKRYLYWSLKANVTNYYKLDGLRQHILIILQFWWPVQGGFLWVKIKVLAGLRFFQKIQSRVIFLPFPASRSHPLPSSRPGTASQVFLWLWNCLFWFCLPVLKMLVIPPAPLDIPWQLYHLKLSWLSTIAICNLNFPLSCNTH